MIKIKRPAIVDKGKELAKGSNDLVKDSTPILIDSRATVLRAPDNQRGCVTGPWNRPTIIMDGKTGKTIAESIDKKIGR